MAVISKEIIEQKPLMIDDSNLPDWLLFEILRRLPLKSIFMFKSVSKRWLSLISDPFFGYSYANNNNVSSLQSWSQQPWTLLFRYLFEVNIPSYMMEDRVALINPHDQDFSSPSFSLRFLPSEQRCPIKILASNNGLLLCCSRIYWQKIYYVCNPLTMKWVSLPKPPRTLRWVSVGFISNNDNYKVVRFPVDEIVDGQIELEIFSSETGEWRDSKLKCPVFDYYIKTDCLVVPFKGYLHWQDFKQNKIICFDPNNCKNFDHQELCFFDLPRDRESRLQRGMGICCNRLCYFEVTDDYLKPYCNLSKWVLTDYENGEWELEHRTKFCDLWSDDDEINRGLQMSNFNLFPLAIHPLDSDLVYFWYERCLVSYCLKTTKLQVIRSNFYSHEVLPFLLPPWPTQVPLPSW